MNIHMFTAVPDSSSPAPNAAIPTASAPSGPRRSAHCPATTIPNRLVVKYEEKANAYSDTPSSSRAATGMAVPTAVASKAMRRTTAMVPMLRARCDLPRMPTVPPGSPVPPGAAGRSMVEADEVTSASADSRALMSPQ